MSTKTDQELHVAAELELFEKRQQRFRCKGPIDQDLSKVMAKIERTAKQAGRGAESKTRQALVAKAAGDEERAGQLERQAAAQSEAAAKLDALGALVLEAAAKVKDAVEGDVQTRHVVTFLLYAERKSDAALLKKTAHAGCGQDLGPTIAALPRPCDSEPYVCSRCGREGHATKGAIAAEAAAE